MNKILIAWIDELKEKLQEVREEGELEKEFDIALKLGDAEDWLKKDCNVIWLECGLCHGSGIQKDYEDTWECPACLGLGGNYNLR